MHLSHVEHALYLSISLFHSLSLSFTLYLSLSVSLSQVGGQERHRSRISQNNSAVPNQNIAMPPAVQLPGPNKRWTAFDDGWAIVAEVDDADDLVHGGNHGGRRSNQGHSECWHLSGKQTSLPRNTRARTVFGCFWYHGSVVLFLFHGRRLSKSFPELFFVQNNFVSTHGTERLSCCALDVAGCRRLQSSMLRAATQEYSVFD